MPETTDPLHRTSDLVLPDHTALHNELVKGLNATVFSNRMLISPRRLNSLASEEANAFLNYATVSDAAAIRERGHHLALEGLGYRSVLNIAATIRRICLHPNHLNGGLSRMLILLEGYAEALLEGYFAGYETELRREQQRTHEAYQRSIQNQKTDAEHTGSGR